MSESDVKVTIKCVDNTAQWTWIRSFPVTVLLPITPENPVSEATEEQTHSVTSNTTYSSSDEALAHAKLVNADVTDPAAFVVE